MDPTSQGQQSPAATAGGNADQNPNGQPKGVPEGVQARFDEMTARYHEVTRALEQSSSQNSQLMQLLTESQAKMAELSVRPVEPVGPPVEIDPEERKKMEYLLGPVLQNQRKMEQMFSQLQTQLGQVGFQQNFQQIAPTEDPRVVARAREIADALTKKGLSAHFNAEDVVNIAFGEISRRDRAKAKAGNPARQDFNGYAAPLGGQPAVNLEPPPPVQELPTGFEEWDPDKQAAFFLARMKQAGGGVARIL